MNELYSKISDNPNDDTVLLLRKQVGWASTCVTVTACTDAASSETKISEMLCLDGMGRIAKLKWLVGVYFFENEADAIYFILSH
jgi:hypothetical protein